MIRGIINTVPFWWLMLLSILFFITITYAAACVSAYFFPKKVDDDYRRYVNSLIGILGSGFSILLALTIVNAWSYQVKIQDALSRETSALSIIHLGTSVFPLEIKNKINTALSLYTQMVRTDEWQTMKYGKESQKAWAAFDQMYASILTYQPDQNRFLHHQQLLLTMNELLNARQNRLSGINSVIPYQLRFSLILGSICLTLILGWIREECYILGVIPALSFAGILGFNLALALSLDYPYSGDISIRAIRHH